MLPSGTRCSWVVWVVWRWVRLRLNLRQPSRAKQQAPRNKSLIPDPSRHRGHAFPVAAILADISRVLTLACPTWAKCPKYLETELQKRTSTMVTSSQWGRETVRRNVRSTLWRRDPGTRDTILAAPALLGRLSTAGKDRRLKDCHAGLWKKTLLRNGLGLDSVRSPGEAVPSWQIPVPLLLTRFESRSKEKQAQYAERVLKTGFDFEEVAV
jgi:hypothetical protein